MQFDVVIQYKNLLRHMANIIEASGYRNDYIAKKLGLKPQSFSMKKQRQNWTPDEVEKILTVIDNEDVEEYLLLQQMRSLKDEETITLEEFKKQAGWK